MKSPPAAPAAGAYSAVSRKLMASMGWSEGKGLGKNEQGADKHIEHKKRGDNVGLGADAHPVLAMRRCGYGDSKEPVKEGSERSATAALSRDLKCAFGAERDTTTRG